MSDLTFVDAAYADAITGGPYDGVCFYIGGDAYHVWPKSDVDGRPERYRLPVWVRDDPSAYSADGDASNCLAALRGYGVPAGSLVALDTEETADPAWVRIFVDVLNASGYKVIDYGSQSSVFGNDNPDGYYWGAQWTGAVHIAAGDEMTQYVSFSNEDLDEATASLPFWDTRPGPDPLNVPAWQEALVNSLPTLQNGSEDTGGQPLMVHRVQQLVNGISEWNDLGVKLTVDGNYGADTEAGVKKVQAKFSLTQDGVTGPDTWSVLIAG